LEIEDCKLPVGLVIRPSLKGGGFTFEKDSVTEGNSPI